MELRAIRFTDTLVNEVTSKTIPDQGEKQMNNNGAEQAGRTWNKGAESSRTAIQRGGEDDDGSGKPGGRKGMR